MDHFQLTLPADPKYLSLARLVASGIVLEKRLPIDDVEDIQLLMTESLNLALISKVAQELTIDIDLSEGEISFSVSGVDRDRVEGDEKLRFSEMILDSLADGMSIDGGAIHIVKALRTEDPLG
ncbi:MAG: hypothetical protein Q4E76_02750 [Tissierellia bacterium]|nr:hypothetical protein [Tissierellia bacterium]